MEKRKLEKTESFESITKWLNDNLSNDKFFTPHVDLIPQIEEKGIYFWFMRPSGYLALSTFVTIKPIEPRYSKIINGELCDLVYLGTAGVKNNSNGINNGTLRQRFNWHLIENKNESSVISGIMSTFRRTIIPLFSDDLLLNNEQIKLDELFKKLFSIYYLSYQGDFNQIANTVRNDEGILIDKLRPIFNIKDNENRKIENHLTYKIRQRRILIEKSTKLRLGQRIDVKMNKEIIGSIKSIKSNKKSPKSCQFEFNGHNYVLSYNDKPRLFENGVEIQRGISTILKKLIDDKKLPITYDRSTTTQQFTKNVIRLYSLTLVNEQIESSIKHEYIDIKSTIFLIPCSSKKLKDIDLENKPFEWSNLAFANELTEYRKNVFELVSNANSHERWKNKIKIDVNKKIDFTKTRPAHEIYSPGRLFGAAESINWCNNKNEKVYIISALFGLIRSDNYIPNYDFALGDLINNVETNYWYNKLDALIEKLLGDECQIVSLLSNNYSNILNHTILNQLSYPNINWSDSYGNHKGVWLKSQLNQIICE